MMDGWMDGWWRTLLFFVFPTLSLLLLHPLHLLRISCHFLYIRFHLILLTARLPTLVPISFWGEAHDAFVWNLLLLLLWLFALSTIAVTTAVTSALGVFITKTKCFSDQDHVMPCHVSDTPVKPEWCGPMSDIFQNVFTARDLHLWKRKIGSIVSWANASWSSHPRPTHYAPPPPIKICSCTNCKNFTY